MPFSKCPAPDTAKLEPIADNPREKPREITGHRDGFLKNFLPQWLRMNALQKKAVLSGIQQIDEVGLRVLFFEPGGFACSPGAEQEKVVIVLCKKTFYYLHVKNIPSLPSFSQ